MVPQKIEKMENFIFSELIPQLQKDYKSIDHITIVGHSRTAFLVNYLTIKQSKRINKAISLSGFYNNEPLSIEKFKDHISNPSNFSKKFEYYFTVGSTLEETTYLKECKVVAEFITNKQLPTNFTGNFTENPTVNHMTNYWISIPAILIESNSSYNSILDNWFYTKLKSNTIENPIEEFKTDLIQVGKQIGFNVNPSLTQIFSLASSYAYEKNNLSTAIAFIKLGQEYYPRYLEFDLTLVAFYKQLNNVKMSEYHKMEYKNKVIARNDIDFLEKQNLLKNIEE